MRALQIGITVVRIELERLVDQFLATAPGGLESLLPIAGDLVLGDEQLGFRQADVGGGKLRDRVLIARSK